MNELRVGDFKSKTVRAPLDLRQTIGTRMFIRYTCPQCNTTDEFDYQERTALCHGSDPFETSLQVKYKMDCTNCGQKLYLLIS